MFKILDKISFKKACDFLPKPYKSDVCRKLPHKKINDMMSLTSKTGFLKIIIDSYLTVFHKFLVFIFY
jgi:hypothetical protein